MKLMKMKTFNQTWLVRGERFDHYDPDSADCGVLFEMTFTDRESAVAVYQYGEKKFHGNPAWRWSLTPMISNENEYALHDIDMLARDFSNEVNHEINQ